MQQRATDHQPSERASAVRHARHEALAAALVAALALPALVHADDRPTTREVYDAWNAPVFVTGALVFAGSYGGSALVARSSTHAAADGLYVPLVGPWLALGGWGACPVDEPRCDRMTSEKAMLVADGLFQAAGVVTMLTALVAPASRTVVVAPPALAKRQVSLAPIRRGLAIVGRF